MIRFSASRCMFRLPMRSVTPSLPLYASGSASSLEVVWRRHSLYAPRSPVLEERARKREEERGRERKRRGRGEEEEGKRGRGWHIRAACESGIMIRKSAKERLQLVLLQSMPGRLPGRMRMNQPACMRQRVPATTQATTNHQARCVVTPPPRRHTTTPSSLLPYSLSSSSALSHNTHPRLTAYLEMRKSCCKSSSSARRGSVFSSDTMRTVPSGSPDSRAWIAE